MQNRYFLDVNILIDLLVNSNYKNVRSSDDVPNLTKSKIKEILSDKDKNLCHWLKLYSYCIFCFNK